MAKMKNLIIFIVLLICLNITSSFTQIRNADFRLHDRGMLWETMKDDGTIGAPNPTNPYEYYPSMDWPGGPHTHVLKQEQRSYMVGAGLWMGGRHGDGTLFFTENGPFERVDAGTFEGIVKEENFVEGSNYNPNEAEEIIRADFTTTENIRVQRTSRAWSFDGLNNFIIVEYVLTNQNSTPVSDFFVGFPYLIRPSYQDFNVHNGWGDDLNRSDERVNYDSSRRLLYSYDDTPNASLPTDVGNWWDQKEELRTPGYAGFAFLHIDPASDNSPQPANVFYAQLLNNANRFTLSSTTTENIYDILTGIDSSLQATPDDRIVPFMLMSCGPYDISASGQVRIVVVQAVDGLSIEDVIDIATENVATAQANLPQGLGMLQGTIDRAKGLFDNNYQLAAISPPSPVVEIIPIPRDKSMSLSWSDEIESNWVNPISGRSNFKEYRIYRSERSFIGPYKRIKVLRHTSASHIRDYFDDELKRWIYKDKEIQLGVSYYYAVVSRDSTGEQSFYTNRNEEAVRSANEPAENALNVIVFPNPFYKESGFPTTGEEDSIVWTNLPQKCTIKIYTTSGELVRKNRTGNILLDSFIRCR